jgi:4-amino-4-deoxy-L-arabinose transferase-like glycosyltransferase
MRARFHSPTDTLRHIPTTAWLVAGLGLALILRCYNVDTRSLWFDESITALAVQHDGAQILAHRFDPMQPPAYFLLLHFWQSAGERLGLLNNEASLRSFSVLWSMAAIPIVYLLGRRLFRRQVGVLAALLMSVAPFQIAYAQEVRSYSLVVFCGALLLWLFVRALDYDRARDWTLLSVIAVFALYVNYLLALLLIVFHFYAFCLPQRHRWWRRLLALDAVLILSLLPLAADLRQQSQQLSAAYRLAAPTILAPLVTATFLYFGYITTSPVLVAASLCVMLTSLIWISLPMVRQPFRSQLDSRWLLLLTVLLPPVLMLIVSFLIQPVYYDRWFAFVTPALVLFLAQGMLTRPFVINKVLLVSLIVFSAVRLTSYYTQPDPARPPYREASRYIQIHAQPGDVVFHLHDSTFPSFRYYAPDMATYLWHDDAASWLVPAAWPWFGERTRDLSMLFCGYSRVWVMSQPDTLDDSRRDLLQQIKQRAALTTSRHFANIEVDLYTVVQPPEAGH